MRPEVASPTSDGVLAVEHADRRLRERVKSALGAGSAGRLIVLSGVVGIVLINTVADALAGYFLLTSDIGRYRAWLVVSMGLTGVINVILVMIAWILFDAIGRIERESERVQVFMDNMYRRNAR